MTIWPGANNALQVMSGVLCVPTAPEPTRYEKGTIL